MLSLDRKKLIERTIPVGTGWLLGSCMEARGKQDLWIRQKPEVLEVLREQAIIQSAESSNRIEGVTIAADRLRPVVLGKTKPRDRPEEELAGYRQALNWIFSRSRQGSLTPAVIQRLHALAQGGFSGDAGKWKKQNNEIVEILPSGQRKVRFVPTSAKDTPKAMERLCRNYRETYDDERVPPLLIVATFVFDLLCIHPFRDGNGRVSRLATTLLLQRHGFQVARYVSLERLVEETRDDYYGVLVKCSQGWHEDKNEIVPWWNYFLSVLHRAYKELQRQVESVEAHPAKSNLVRQTILAQVERFTLGDLAAQLPTVSPQLIKKVLAKLKNQGKIRLTGRGRGARWELYRGQTFEISTDQRHASDRELRLQIVHSDLSGTDRERILRLPREERVKVTRECRTLGEFPCYISDGRGFEVPVYAVWGNHEDKNVVERLFRGDIEIENLHLLHHRRAYKVGPVLVYGLGGNFLVSSKLLQKPIAGGGGKIWSTVSQYADLIETVEKAAELPDLRILVSHVSPGKEPFVELIGARTRADFTVSGHMGAPTCMVWNPFAISSVEEATNRLSEGLDAVRRACINAAKTDASRVDQALSLIRRIPADTIHIGRGIKAPRWYRGMTHVNLSDAYLGYAVLDADETGVRLQTFAVR